MKKCLSLLLLPVVVGCLSTSVPHISSWTISYPSSQQKTAAAISAEGNRHGAVRVSQVSVRPPYDSKSIVVLRADGSVAFDAYNQFSAQPASLLREAAIDALNNSEKFRAAVLSTSSLRTEFSMELSVRQLALDCRTEGSRTAKVTLAMLILKDREVFATVSGEGEADAMNGDYSSAFSEAFAAAIKQALGRL